MVHFLSQWYSFIFAGNYTFDLNFNYEEEGVQFVKALNEIVGKLAELDVTTDQLRQKMGFE